MLRGDEPTSVGGRAQTARGGGAAPARMCMGSMGCMEPCPKAAPRVGWGTCQSDACAAGPGWVEWSAVLLECALSAPPRGCWLSTREVLPFHSLSASASTLFCAARRSEKEVKSCNHALCMKVAILLCGNLKVSRQE